MLGSKIVIAEASEGVKGRARAQLGSQFLASSSSQRQDASRDKHAHPKNRHELKLTSNLELILNLRSVDEDGGQSLDSKYNKNDDDLNNGRGERDHAPNTFSSKTK